MQSECKYLTAYLASFWYGKQENKPCRRFFFFLILDFPLWKKVKNNTPKTQTSDTAFF